MKNEIDEDFRFIQKEIKQTLVEIMTNIIETENPKYTKVTVDVVLDKRLKGKISLHVLEALLKTMYPDDTYKQDELYGEILKDNKVTLPPTKLWVNKISFECEERYGRIDQLFIY